MNDLENFSVLPQHSAESVELLGVGVSTGNRLQLLIHVDKAGGQADRTVMQAGL